MLYAAKVTKKAKITEIEMIKSFVTKPFLAFFELFIKLSRCVEVYVLKHLFCDLLHSLDCRVTAVF